MKKVLKILIVVIAVLLVAEGAFLTYLAFGNKAKTEKDPAGTTAAQTTAAEEATNAADPSQGEESGNVEQSVETEAPMTFATEDTSYVVPEEEFDDAPADTDPVENGETEAAGETAPVTYPEVDVETPEDEF